jgi:hypothetical protein
MRLFTSNCPTLWETAPPESVKLSALLESIPDE